MCSERRRFSFSLLDMERANAGDDRAIVDYMAYDLHCDKAETRDMPGDHR